MDSSFGPLEAMRLSVLTDSPVWVILSEVSLWDRKCTERGCGVEGRAALSSSEEVLEEVLGGCCKKSRRVETSQGVVSPTRVLQVL